MFYFRVTHATSANKRIGQNYSHSLTQPQEGQEIQCYKVTGSGKNRQSLAMFLPLLRTQVLSLFKIRINMHLGFLSCESP
jgi:hypothetical protein